jgi:4'-phosphopantetheinyl transferase
VQPEAFFNCWTRKEAYLKARADGLSFPLDQFSVSLIPGEPAALLSFLGDPDEIARWSLIHLNPGSDYVGTLVVEGPRLRLRTFQLL